MQSYALNNLRRQVQSGEIPKDDFNLGIHLHDNFSVRDMLEAKEGDKAWNETHDICMLKHRECQYDIYMFYMY